MLTHCSKHCRGALRQRVLSACAIAVLATLASSNAFAGRLSSSRSSSRGSSGSSSSHSSGSSSGSSSSAFRNSSFGYGYGGGGGYWMWQMLASPWTLPHYAMGDNYDLSYAFPSAPYAGGINGYVRTSGITGGIPGAERASDGRILLGHSTAFRVATEGTWVDSNMQRFGLSALLSGNHRWEIGTDWSFYQENADGIIDRQWIGTINASFVFAQSEHAQFRTGVGVRMMPTNLDNQMGINLLYGMDFYPTDPLILSIRGDVGNVGDAFAAEARASAGIVIGALEFYGGYHKMWIGDQAFGGPTVGLRVWN